MIYLLITTCWLLLSFYLPGSITFSNKGLGNPYHFWKVSFLSFPVWQRLVGKTLGVHWSCWVFSKSLARADAVVPATVEQMKAYAETGEVAGDPYVLSAFVLTILGLDLEVTWLTPKTK